MPLLRRDARLFTQNTSQTDVFQLLPVGDQKTRTWVYLRGSRHLKFARQQSVSRHTVGCARGCYGNSRAQACLFRHAVVVATVVTIRQSRRNRAQLCEQLVNQPLENRLTS